MAFLPFEAEVGLENGLQRGQRLPVWLLPIVVALVAGAVSGAAVSLLLDDDSGMPTSDTATELGGLPGPAPSLGGQGLAETVTAVLPSVVTVINEQPEGVDDQGRIIGSVAIGSGFIIAEQGYVLTNEHVIHELGELTVVLDSGEERSAQLVSHDAPFTDLAVLKIAPGNLTPVRFGDSDDLELGETVIASGTALFEYSSSVSTGVVSGLHRRWLRQGVYMEDLIQTDAAVNAGNSGGPLFTLDGEVVGITTNVVRQLGSIDTIFGIAFAISSKTMQPIAEAIVERGHFPRPLFGIEHQNIDLELVSLAGLDVSEGAFIVNVFANTPAAAAGLRPGDIVLRVDQFEITGDLPFTNALSRFDIDDTVNVRIWRDGRVLALDVELRPR